MRVNLRAPGNAGPIRRKARPQSRAPLTHAEQTKASEAVRGVQLLLQLQRRNGNRYVQKVVELSRGSNAQTAVALDRVRATQTQSAGTRIQRQQEATSGPAAETQAAGQTNDDQQVSEAIRNALRQYQEMPIDVPVTSPRDGEERRDEAERVYVRVPYFLNKGRRQEAATAAREGSPAVRSVLRGIPIETRVGKGSPAQVRQFVQEQVNRGIIRQRRGGWPPTAVDIRRWMQTYGIGIDCSGFVYWALWQVQASRGGEQAAEVWAGQFRNRWGLVVRGWGGLLRGAQRIRAPSQLQAGDIAQLQTTGSIGHYRIVMETRREGEYFYFTLAESSGGAEGPQIREFRARSDVTNFRRIEVQRQGRWRSVRGSNYHYWRRADTSQAAPSGGQQETGMPGEAGAGAAPTSGSLPSREEVYGTPRTGGSAATKPPTRVAEVRRKPTWLRRAVARNASFGSRLGWASRVDEIVLHFQNLGYVPPLQTPNEEAFARAVRQYQSQYPRLANDGIMGPNTWRQLRADMNGKDGGTDQQASGPPSPRTSDRETVSDEQPLERQSHYKSQLENTFRRSKYIEEKTGKIKYHVDKGDMCNVTTLAMQLITLTRDENGVKGAVKDILGERRYPKSPAELDKMTLADLLAALIYHKGKKPKEWRKRLKDTFPHINWEKFRARKGDFILRGPILVVVGLEILDRYGIAGKGERIAGTKTAEELGAGSDGAQRHFEGRLLPKLKDGAAVMLGTALTEKGHIVYLDSIIKDKGGGILVNDPFGMRLLGYKKNGSRFDPRVMNKKNYGILERRTRYNPDLLARIGKLRRGERFPKNMGERNFYSWDEVSKYMIGKSASILSVAK